MDGKKVSLVIPVVWTALICGQALLASCTPATGKGPMTAQPKSDYDSAGVEIGNTKGFEIKNGYTFNMANAPTGAFTSGWAYLGGRAGSGPVYYQDNTGFLPADLWSGSAIDIATSSFYVAAAALAFCSLWYTFGPLIMGPIKPTKKSGGKVSTPTNNNSTTSDSKKDSELSLQNKEDKKLSQKSRRRREIKSPITSIQHSYLADTELTRLASIVLNAIASGECLQKTICQFGTQIGTSPNGRLAFNLIDTLLPVSVHNNIYFLTMKKALRGESSCDRFNCHYS